MSHFHELINELDSYVLSNFEILMNLTIQFIMYEYKKLPVT
jgi:hypothetical protein